MPSNIKVADVDQSVFRVPVNNFIGTATAKLPNHGVVTIFATSGTKTFTIMPPVPGCLVFIKTIDATTDILTITTGSTSIGFNVAGAGTLTFNAADEAVILCGLSTTRYGVFSNNGAVGVAAITT